jgi:protein-ribulosamine 3-kinase
MVDTSIWDQEIAVPETVISYVDDNVAESKLSIALSVYLPPRVLPLTRLVRAPSGLDHQNHLATWCILLDSHCPYPITRPRRQCSFLLSQGQCPVNSVSRSFANPALFQVSQGDVGKGMMSGEFASMSALHKAMSDLAPRPIGWGVYAKEPDIYFFLCAFHDMTDDVPDVSTLPAMVAQLHKNGVSPTGKFGFPVTTYQGRLPQDTTECDTWEESFSRSIRRFFELEEESQGYEEEMAQLRKGIMEKVIPRLLRPLENGGRSVVPRLVHGDLWDGNTSVDAGTDLPVIFDACSSYAHHECEYPQKHWGVLSDYTDLTCTILDELAPWRPTRHKISKPYVTEYLKHFPISEPAEDFDDRNALYCV